jgi:hypothetical protein
MIHSIQAHVVNKIFTISSEGLIRLPGYNPKTKAKIITNHVFSSREKEKTIQKKKYHE